LTQLVDHDYRRVASRRDVAGRNLDLSGMPADVLETLPGCGKLFVRHSPACGTGERHCRWQQALLAMAAAAATALIARSSPSLTRGIVETGKLR